MRSFVIRQSTPDDAAGILACLHSAFAAYQKDYTPAAFEDTVLTRETLIERQKTMAIFVAETASGAIVGTIACGVVGGDEGHLRGMAVHPAWHGFGIAQQLLERAETELRKLRCRRITLDTTEYLKRAIRFYERNGYKPSGKVSDFFGMPLHEYRKPL